MPRATFLTELRQHQVQHQERWREDPQIEPHFFPNPRVLAIPAQFQYLTLRNGIRFETGG